MYPLWVRSVLEHKVGVTSRSLIRACVITNGLRTVRGVKWLPVNNETLAAIMIVGNALFNDSSGESSHEERAIFAALNQSRRGVILSQSYITCITNTHHFKSPVGCTFIIAIDIQDNGDNLRHFLCIFVCFLMNR